MTDEQSLALNSLYFHANYGDDPGWPVDYRPLPLHEAAQILASVTNVYDVSARRRGAAQLLASPRRSHTDATDPYNEAVVTMIPAVGPMPPVIDFVDTGGPGVPPALFASYLRELNAFGPPLPCCHTEPDTHVDFDPFTGLIHGRSQLAVRRSFTDLCRILDPQHWHDMVPEYFVRACVADCPEGQCVVDPETHDASCHSRPPKPGSQWAAPLFEHYRLNIAQTIRLVQFKNLLTVESIPGDKQHRFTYGLRNVLYGEIATIKKIGSGLDVDGGYIQLADRGDGWVDLVAVKDFHLTDWDPPVGDYLLNWWTSVTTRTTLDAAYEAVCKDV